MTSRSAVSVLMAYEATNKTCFMTNCRSIVKDAHCSAITTKYKFLKGSSSITNNDNGIKPPRYYLFSLICTLHNSKWTEKLQTNKRSFVC